MTGQGPIVIAARNSQQFCEHMSLDRATKEAERLAERHGREFIVYVPVSISKPAPKVVTERLENRDLPF